ncbi:hypothetical protein NMG60_11005797 [Bertholletia excelsa]
MGGFDDYKPAMGMIAVQLTYAGVALLTRAALLQGMSPRIFVFYRQCIATLVIAPIAYFTRKDVYLGLRGFCLIFLASLVGVTINQNVYFEGIHLTSSSMGGAMFNLIPAVTFVMASILGLEKVNIRSLRSNAKIIGTIICVVGAVSMVLLRGSKLLNSELLSRVSLLSSVSKNWLLGSLFLFGSSCCWAVWLIIQVPVLASHPNHVSLSAWMCFMAALQAGLIALFMESDQEAWKLHSYLELAACSFAGIVASAISVFITTWCISRRGPLFCATFSPLTTVAVTFFAAILLHEEVYTGSLISAVVLIVGLYVVLWGKAEDLNEKLKMETNLKPKVDEAEAQNVQVFVDEFPKKMNCNVDLEEPLLSDKSENLM